jgi:predicted kinase
VPKAYLICGFLGSGKTTFAKRLETQETALRLTHDEWMVQLYGRNPPAEKFSEYASRVSRLQESIWLRWLELGGNVVLDLNFWSRSHRDRTRELVATRRADSVLYYLTCSENTARQRVARRTEKADSLVISDETFNVLQHRWEEPQQDEDFSLISTEP